MWGPPDVGQLSLADTNAWTLTYHIGPVEEAVQALPHVIRDRIGSPKAMYRNRWPWSLLGALSCIMLACATGKLPPGVTQDIYKMCKNTVDAR